MAQRFIDRAGEKPLRLPERTSRCWAAESAKVPPALSWFPPQREIKSVVKKTGNIPHRQSTFVDKRVSLAPRATFTCRLLKVCFFAGAKNSRFVHTKQIKMVGGERGKPQVPFGQILSGFLKPQSCELSCSVRGRRHRCDRELRQQSFRAAQNPKRSILPLANTSRTSTPAFLFALIEKLVGVGPVFHSSCIKKPNDFKRRVAKEPRRAWKPKPSPRYLIYD